MTQTTHTVKKPAPKGKRRYRFSYFYTILLLFILVSMIALFFGLRFLTDVLEDYENAQPQYLAQSIFDEYYREPDAEKLLSLANTDGISGFETEEHLKNYFASLTDGKEITFNSVSTGLDQDTAKYVVKADGKKFAAFVLTKSGEKSRYGFDLFKLDSLETYTKGSEGVRIKAPSTSTVLVNGLPLTGEQAVETGIKTLSCDYMPEGVEGITYTVYEVKGLLAEPEITAADKDGVETPVTFDEDSQTYCTDILYSEALKEEYGSYVLEAAEKYAAFMQNDTYFGAIAPYFEQGTPLYEGIRTSLTMFVIDHTSYSFEDESVSEFYAYDENTFSCRVSFKHVLHKYGSADYVDYFDTTYYLRNVDGKFVIYDRYTN